MKLDKQEEVVNIAELCPVHNKEFKLIPAGVSKSTGRPYDAFYACPERSCKERPASESRKKPSAGGMDLSEVIKNQESILEIVNGILRLVRKPGEDINEDEVPF